MFLFPKELYIFCKFFGVLPVKVQKQPSGAEINQFSPITFAWSLMFITTLCLFSTYALYFDYTGMLHGMPVRMRTYTAVVATVCDVTTLIIVSMVGVIASGRHCNKLIQMMDDLKRFDKILDSSKPATPNTRIYLIIVLIYVTLLLCADGIIRYQLSEKHEVYVPFLMLYYILCAIHMQYVHIVMNIKLRFELVNERIKQEVARKRFKTLINSHRLPKVELLLTGSQIRPLIDQYWFLQRLYAKANMLYNYQMLTVLFSNFIHTTITFYFFLLDLLYSYSQGSTNDFGHLMMQILWITTHVLQLILLVQPNNAANLEANKTAPIVCKLLNQEMSSELRKQLETFVLQLLHHNAEFSAFGLFRMQCPIITSIAGAVTTYLVILIQFQNSDNN